MRIPRYKTSIPYSDISDGTPPVFADSEARAERFLQKSKFFSDRADKILYFPSLTFVRQNFFCKGEKKFFFFRVLLLGGEFGVPPPRSGRGASQILSTKCQTRKI